MPDMKDVCANCGAVFGIHAVAQNRCPEPYKTVFALQPPTPTDSAVVAALERWMVKGNMSITISPPHDGFPWGVDWLTGDDGDWDVKSHRVTGDTLHAAILAATKEQPSER